MTRIAFFAQLGFHAPILKSVADELEGRTVAGSRVELLLSGDRRAVVRFGPEIVVMAAIERLEYFRHHLPGARIGTIRHGIGNSKRVASRLPDRPSARRLDFVFAGERSVLERFAESATEPAATWFTGYPPLDPLFRRARAEADAAGGAGAAAATASVGQRTVVYAPTWNLGLSSAPFLGAEIATAIRGTQREIRIVIKPHPVIPGWRPEWMRAWRLATAREPNMELIEDGDADVVPHLLAADVLVTDASSVALSFLALDRPIVWFTSPRATADPAFEPQDLLWRRRDVGTEVAAVEHLAAAVADALHDPRNRGPQRRDVATALFAGWDDGCSARRAADHLLELAAMPPAERPGIEPALARPPEPAWRLQDLRVSLRNQATLRRLVLGHLEDVRLRTRERSMARAATAAETAPTDGPAR